MRATYTRSLLVMLTVILAACGTLAPPKSPPSPAPKSAHPPVAARPAPMPKPPAPSGPSAPLPPAAAPVEPAPMAPEEPQPAPPEVTQPTPAESIPQVPAVVALLDSASRQEKAGRLESAAATLERALRVDPRNAVLWHRLARVRLAQRQWQAAASFAAKSNSLAPAGTDLPRRNWSLIAQAREQMGDKAGAISARANAAR